MYYIIYDRGIAYNKKYDAQIVHPLYRFYFKMLY